MEGFLRVENNTNLPGSPTNSFLADEVASICPLITPSPPPNDLINALPEPTEADFGIGQDLATKLQQVQDEEKADSASSNSSVLAEPACTQLLNHRNVYHHIVKDEDTETKETNGKVQPLQLTFRNPPDNYFFMSWNWPLIRKICLWIFLSGLVAMVALVVAMIYTLPKTCNPTTYWYQGNVLYEVFPASFNIEDSMVGNLKDISKRADYFTKLGVKGVRLNSIFATQNYPHDYENVKNLIDIDSSLGDLNAFSYLTKTLESRDIYVILDLPVYPLVKYLPNKKISDTKNDTIPQPVGDVIQEAILHWTGKGVKGFYLKGLENLVNDPNFAQSLRSWKRILGQERVLIVSESVINESSSNIINTVLNNVDLVDVKLNLDIKNDATAVGKQISFLQNGTLFSTPGMPWVHWSLGGVKSRRLANILNNGNGTLGATLLQLMLPGTVSIFYGDEIGLREIVDDKNETHSDKHLHQLTVMPWLNQRRTVLPWLSGIVATPHFEQINLIAEMIAIRVKSPSIYMNSVFKDNHNKANAEVKYAQDEFLVMQRWYPRRKAFVVACNLGDQQISRDLSGLLYKGDVIVGPRVDSTPGTISFKDISLWPGESVIVILE
ncbi:hypothetical protein NQ318_016703 [Aromia moschata]|uniref:Glycosyl hydrolase family 13 catalytic domain-containing protein n=1 Tax=Aromia moschata TaxID=1265417 RepID=A0AAV8XNA4_9CUCU|nr:hypothetical protein NQ318_016703 [Aromia moschata]